MNKQEVESEVLKDFKDLVKQANNSFNKYKKKNTLENLNELSFISLTLHHNKYKAVLDLFLKETGLYSKMQFILQKAINCEEMDHWVMSFVNTSDTKMCRFSFQKRNIDFKIPLLEEQVSLICSNNEDYFGIIYSYYLSRSQSMILETAVCCNLLLTILDGEKRKAA